ncbi:MAG: hypothetical protein COU35_00810, partial [Candidatus Magasanikbacteria bacterium CG10_big_fil_rev_8_21_14_0_10_47_10]
MRHKTLIYKNLLQTFMRQKQLPNIVEFLRFIKNKKNFQSFYLFCGKHNHLLPEPIFNTVLFHGSTKAMTALEPNTSVGQDGRPEQSAFVYATDDPNYAIFLALLNIKENGGASVYAGSYSTKLSISLGFVNGSSKLKDGYVNIIDSSGFKKTKNREYKSNKKTEVL